MGAHLTKKLLMCSNKVLLILLSPLHFADIDSEGNIKSLIFIVFSNGTVKGFDTQIKPFFDSFGVVALPTEITSYQGLCSYLCHPWM